MSDDPRSSLRWEFLWAAVFACLGLLLVVGNAAELRAAVLIAGAEPCPPGADGGRCLRTERGTIVGQDEYGVTVRYDDGRRTAEPTVEVDGNVGPRVTLQFWDRVMEYDLVAIRDEERGTTYHTLAWPSGVEATFGLLFGLAFLGVGAFASREAYREWARLRKMPRKPRVARPR